VRYGCAVAFKSSEWSTFRVFQTCDALHACKTDMVNHHHLHILPPFTLCPSCLSSFSSCLKPCHQWHMDCPPSPPQAVKTTACAAPCHCPCSGAHTITGAASYCFQAILAHHIWSERSQAMTTTHIMHYFHHTYFFLS